MYEKLVVQVLGLAKDWYFMKRNLNYKGKVYESLKKLCDENGISYSGLAMYIARDKERHLSDIQSDEEVIEYLLEYIKLKEEGRRKGNYRVKGNIFLGGKLYSNLTDVYKNTKINAPGFSRYCIRNLGIAPADLDESTLIQTLNKYYDKVKSGKTFKSMVRIEYDGKVYSRVKEACLGARVNNKKFENYCMEMFGVMPRYLGDVLSDVFMDFVNSEKVKRYVRLQGLYGDKAEEVMKRISINNMGVSYEGVTYSSVMDACVDLTGSKSQYSALNSYCYDELGISYAKIYEKDIRNDILAEYINRKSTLHRGLEVSYNGKTYKSIKNACNDVGVSVEGFYGYCVANYKTSAKTMSIKERSRVFEEYMANRGGSEYSISYNGMVYNSAEKACKEAEVSFGAFSYFCKKSTGMGVGELSIDERSRLFEEYAKAKGKVLEG